MITPCVQTLQSLGIVTGASHQELQCRLHNPDIESRILTIELCIMNDVMLCFALFSLISVSLPLLFMLFVLVCSPLQ